MKRIVRRLDPRRYSAWPAKEAAMFMRADARRACEPFDMAASTETWQEPHDLCWRVAVVFPFVLPIKGAHR